MGKLIQSMDWSANPLGPVALWPQSLKTTVSLCLSSTSPILIAWGPETIQLYNDSYRPFCGSKHPASMGQNFRSCWESALSVVGDAFTRGQEGEGSYIVDQRMFLDRKGYLEEIFVTFSFAPIRNEAGEVGGVFHSVTETTEKMLAARRTQVIRDLAAQTGKAKTEMDICVAILGKAANFSTDIPFLLLYQVSSKGDHAHLIANAGIAAQTPLTPETVTLCDAACWPIHRVLQNRQYEVVTGLNERLGVVPTGPYPENPHSAILLPVHISGQPLPWGFIVAGVSARRTLDEPYLNFYELLGNAFSTAFSNVRAYEQELQREQHVLDRTGELKIANDELKRINRELEDFVFISSHDLQPLRKIQTFGNIALSADAAQQPVREYLGKMIASASRMSGLIKDLLSYTRLNKSDDPFVTTDLNDIMQQVLSDLEIVIHEKNAQIEIPLLPELKAVPIQINQLFHNLLSNALKFSDRDPVIRVSVALLSPEKQQTLTELESGKRFYELAFQDNGIGFEQKYADQVFTIFKRLVKATEYPGTGIGLTICRKVALNHGGNIYPVSQPGKGTTFYVYLPVI